MKLVIEITRVIDAIITAAIAIFEIIFGSVRFIKNLLYIIL
jgi:hypothetical protein